MRVATLFFVLIGIAPITQVYAQCQAGMPTIGNLCVPRTDPGYTGGSQVQQIPQQPPGPSWIKTWGAIAFDSGSGNAGTVTGLLSERKAKSGAMDACRQKGGADCRILLAYQNQCAAVAWAQEKGVMAGRAASIDEASQIATADCEAKNQAKCNIVYSACSAPVLK